jgi:hypothetical protein
MLKNKHAVILYSGGTDSTCVVFMKANEYETIHLLSYERFGIFNVNNIETNINKLKNVFGNNKFVVKRINVDKIYKLVVYENYFSNLFKYKFFNLAVCALCKLAMHIRTIIYCTENNIDAVFDGANKYAVTTDQSEDVISSIKNLYSKFNISYSAPVYNMLAPKEKNWLDKINNSKEGVQNTTGTFLKEKGFFETDNVKGTSIDRKMQARCFQQFLSNIALKYYYIDKYGNDKYKETLKEFYDNKVKRLEIYLKDYFKNKEKSKLYHYVKTK